MRCVLAVSLVLMMGPRALAIPITGYATGNVTANWYFDAIGPVRPYSFAIGETVDLAYTYDVDAPPNLSVSRIEFTSSGGFSRVFTHPFLSTVRAEGDGLSLLRASRDPWEIIMRFDGGGDVGTFTYGRDLGIGSEGCVATLAKSAGPSHTPEPSTLAMGLVGLVGVCCHYLRGRSEGG